MMAQKTSQESRRNAGSSYKNPVNTRGLHQQHTFFGGTSQASFFQPARAYGMGTCSECSKEEENRHYGAGQAEAAAFTPTLSEKEGEEQNTRHFANCEGVTVEGYTDANYGNSYTAPGTSSPGKDCTECSGEDCVTNTGAVISVFTANPRVTLPLVPSGLNECEHRAVQNFINTTLNNHELQHVAAFNTYRGSVRTPYTYHGCAGGLDAYTRQIHENNKTARKASSDAASAALDANGANIFNVTCDCPDPEPEEENAEQSE